MRHEYLRRTHRSSALILAAFLFFHLINHLMGIGGADLHIRVMSVLRTVYRFWFVEAILLTSCVVQIASGLMLAWAKRTERQFFSRLQIVSGLYLSFFIVFHVRAVLMGRFVWNVDTDFHFAAWGVKNYPSMIFFVPYYGLSIAALFAHLASVHYSKMIGSSGSGEVGRTRQVRWQAAAIIFAGLCMAVTVVTILAIK